MPRVWRTLRTSALRIAAVALIGGAVVAAVVLGASDRHVGSKPAPTTTTVADPGDLPADIWLDPSGRPYDVAQAKQYRTGTAREKIGSLTIARGPLLVGDGSILYGVSRNMFKPDPTEFHPVAFTDGADLDVSVIWELTHGGSRRPVGIALAIPGTTVDRWQPFETAYGTDGGEGAITSRGGLDAMTKDASRLKLFDVDAASFVMSDVDGDGKDDTIEFENGFGDGGFPMSRGLDANGALVGLVVWHARLPWRLGVPEGTPPSDVTTREDGYADCLSGKRPLVDGRCRVA